MIGLFGGAIPPLTSIHHVALTATDVHASVAWYKRVFGFQEIGTAPHPGGYGVLLQLPGTELVVVIHHHDANEGEPFAETRTGLDHVGVFRAHPRPPGGLAAAIRQARREAVACHRHRGLQCVGTRVPRPRQHPARIVRPALRTDNRWAVVPTAGEWLIGRS